MKDIFSYRKFWASRLLPVPELPMDREAMDHLEWDSCDIILVTGDAYVDHPSFGMALIGRFLEAQGFRVGIIAQPDWQSVDDFSKIGKPNLFFGVTAGNMDSMVNRYTADRKIRTNDAYTPDGIGGLRPDRSVIVYSQRCREAYSGVPIVIGGIEASLRRIAHYDYWSDKVRRSIIFDAKADILVYGNAERQIAEIAHRAAAGEAPSEMHDIRGTAYIVPELPELPAISDDPDVSDRAVPKVAILPSYELVRKERLAYARASRIFHLETNPDNAATLVQAYGDRYLILNPPPFPLSTKELDRVYETPYTRKPHSSYGEKRIPAYEMIRLSVNIMRGCFGGCTFCSITEHEGRTIQSRSSESVLREIELIRDTVPNFTGNISDIGGPTANMYGLNCKDPEIRAKCRKLSCVYPRICPHLNTNHDSLISLYRQSRKVKGVKKVFVASGVRYDLASRSPEYVRELAEHHVGGYLKIAPEHSEPGPLSKMMKPGIETFYEFKEIFDQCSRRAGKEQYLIPYFIAGHPGSSNEDMMNLSLWLKENKFRPDQVQTFLPSPLSIAATMYHTELNPLRSLSKGGEKVYVPRKVGERKLQKAFLRYHDPANWPLLRKALRRMGRIDLIKGNSTGLVPPASFAYGQNNRAKSTDQKNRPLARTVSRSLSRKKRKVSSKKR